MKCSQCKHWDKEDTIHDSIEGPQISRCKKAIEEWEATEWKKDKDGEELDDSIRVVKPEYKDLKMFTKDGSSYMSKLYTREDFYCAHYETEWRKP